MSVNSYRSIEAEDLLDGVRKHIQETRAGNTSASDFDPNYIRTVDNTITVATTVTLNNNKHTFNNQVNLITPRPYIRDVLKGKFVVGVDNNDQYLNGIQFKGTGSSNPVIVRRSKLEPTAAITLAVVALLIGFTGTIRELIHKQTATAGYRLYAAAGSNNIIVEWYNAGGLISSQTISFTPGVLVTIVATFQSGNQKLYKNGTETDIDTVAAAMAVAALDVGYGGSAAGAERIQTGDVLDQLVIIDRYVGATGTWADEYNKGIAHFDNATDRVPLMVSFGDVGP